MYLHGKWLWVNINYVIKSPPLRIQRTFNILAIWIGHHLYHSVNKNVVYFPLAFTLCWMIIQVQRWSCATCSMLLIYDMIMAGLMYMPHHHGEKPFITCHLWGHMYLWMRTVVVLWYTEWPCVCGLMGLQTRIGKSSLFTIVKIFVTYCISRSYLTGVPAAQLRWHSSNMKVIQRS